MTAVLFAPGFKTEPYWWERTPRPELPDETPPQTVDVAIVGSGYTGLSAALQTARAGRETVLFDAEAAGWGCSARNGGQIGDSVKSSYDELVSSFGKERAFAIVKEVQTALAWTGDFIREEGIDCDFKVCGRFHAAHQPAAYEMLAKKIANQPKGLEVEAHMVPASEQRRELGTDAYHGGVVYPHHASVDPARYHQALLERAQTAGARVFPFCPVTAIARDGEGFRLTTAKGQVAARQVLVATNGYTGGLTPWQQRRVIPIGSYMIATEPLEDGLIDRLFPTDRVVSDSRRLVYYYRASPDRSRVLFGGRVSLKETDAEVSGPRLHAEVSRIFPELASVRLSHSWFGYVAYTFDKLPHVGQQDGLYYAMGYCGTGVAWACYLGMRVGQQMLGLKEGRTVFEDLNFQTRPLYYGDPWFLAPSIRYYRWRDAQDR